MEFIQQNIYLVILACASGGALLFLTLRGSSGGNGLSPTQATLLINREDAVVIDVRGADEYAGGHIPEARNIPLDRLEERVGELEKFKERPILLVCQSGARSGKALQQLAKLGFSRLHNLDGGVGAWATAGLPLKKGAKK